MKIEKGKTYALSNMFKKSFVENNYYDSGEDERSFERDIVWRSGTVFVCPVNDWDVEQIQELVDQGENRDDTEETHLTDFLEYELSDTWDGVDEVYYTPYEEFGEVLDEMKDAFDDDDELQMEFFDFGSYMEDLGYDLKSTSYYVVGPVLVEESEYQLEVDMSEYEAMDA